MHPVMSGHGRQCVEQSQFVCGQASVGCFDVGAEVAHARCSWDRDDRQPVDRLSVVHPGKGDVPGCGVMRSGDILQRGLHVPGNLPAGGSSPNVKCTLAVGGMRHHCRPEFHRCRQQLLFDAALCYRPLFLQRCDRVDRVRAA